MQKQKHACAVQAFQDASAMNEVLHLLEMEHGGRIALHRLYADRPTGPPVIIAHGTISNAETVRTLGMFLVERGFDCWLLEWAGHGHSVPASPKQNFEYPAFHDLSTAVRAVLHRTQQPRVLWVAHSGGGHLPLMYLTRHPEKQSRFAGIVTMGTQSTHAAPRFREKTVGVVLWCITMLMNRTPKAILPLGNKPEPTRLLLQWAEWNMKQRWLGADGTRLYGSIGRTDGTCRCHSRQSQITYSQRPQLLPQPKKVRKATQ